MSPTIEVCLFESSYTHWKRAGKLCVLCIGQFSADDTLWPMVELRCQEMCRVTLHVFLKLLRIDSTCSEPKTARDGY